jgi:hypothetical protein
VLFGLLLPGCALLMATSPQSESTERHSEMTEMVETDLGPDAEPEAPKPKSAAAKPLARETQQRAEPVFDEILAEARDSSPPRAAAAKSEQASPGADARRSEAMPAEMPAPAHGARPPATVGSAAMVAAPQTPPATVAPPVREPTTVVAPQRPRALDVAPERPPAVVAVQAIPPAASPSPAPLPAPLAEDSLASRPLPRGTPRAGANWGREDTDLIARALPAPEQGAARGGGEFTAVEGGAGRPSGADLSRSPTLADNAKWDCPFPHEASRLGIVSAVVTLRVEVKANSAVDSVIVIQDPGDGFGREALRCVRSKRWRAGLDRAGNAAKRTTVVNIRFQRSS